MTTKVTNSKTQPAIVMDKLHIDSFTLHQERTETSKKVIGCSGVLYGFDADSNMVFDNETIGISDTDIDSTVVLSSIADGRTAEDFMIAYATAKTEVSAEIANGTLDDAKLMAYFESALARIFELHGKISVSGVE